MTALKSAPFKRRGGVTTGGHRWVRLDGEGISAPIFGQILDTACTGHTTLFSSSWKRKKYPGWYLLTFNGAGCWAIEQNALNTKPREKNGLTVSLSAVSEYLKVLMLCWVLQCKGIQRGHRIRGKESNKPQVSCAWFSGWLSPLVSMPVASVFSRGQRGSQHGLPGLWASRKGWVLSRVTGNEGDQHTHSCPFNTVPSTHHCGMCPDRGTRISLEILVSWGLWLEPP